MPKPSFGCMACRQRRVKCDERMGGCLRCERYRIRCPGYQHPLDVLLRHHDDQRSVSNDSAQKRLNIRIDDIDNLNRWQHSVWSATKAAGIEFNPKPPLLQQLSVDFDQAALGAYYTAYCVSSSTLCPLDYVRQQGNGCLWAAIKMLGMLILHQTWQLPGGHPALIQQYTNATKLLNTAIASPTESREDHTLLATLQLSIVEMKASPDFSLDYWLIHTNGAAALMEGRGAIQILSRLGSALFFQISSQIVIYSILGERYIPHALQELRKAMRPYLIKQDHPLWQWHGLMYRLADFWAASCATKSEPVTIDAQRIIDEALSISNDMDVVFQSTGSYWEYATQSSEEFRPLLNHEHVYHSLLTTRVWNDRRTATILLFSVIARTATRYFGQINLDKDPQVYIEDASQIIQNTALETLAAVPQPLASLKGKIFALKSTIVKPEIGLCDSNSEYDEQVFQQTQNNHPPLPYMDSCRVQWSVYFTVRCEFVEPQIRSCLLQVLESSGKIMQIQQWQVLAESVRSSSRQPTQALQG